MVSAIKYELISLANGLPPEVRDLCRDGYRLVKLLEEPKEGDVAYLIKVSSLMRKINSRVLFLLGEAWRRSGEQKEPEEIKSFKEDLKSLQKIMKERPGLIMLYKVGMMIAQIFDILVSTKLKLTKRFPSDEEIDVVRRILTYRYTLFEELVRVWFKLLTHPFIYASREEIEKYKKTIVEVKEKYIDPYFPDVINLDFKRQREFRANDYLGVKPVLIQNETFYLKSLIEAIEKTSWLEEKFGAERVKKIFLMDFEAERNEFYTVFRNQIALRVGTMPTIEVSEG